MLAAALELFSEKGYHNVSMHEIAQKAEFAIGTLYKFFKNKEDLYKALMLEQVDKFHEALTKAIEEPDDEIEKLRNYVRTKGELFRANASMIRLYFAETRGASFNIMAGLDARSANGMVDSLKALPRSLRAESRGNGSGRSPTRTIWPLPWTALPMPFFFSGLKRPNAILTRKTRTPFWIFSSKDW